MPDRRPPSPARGRAWEDWPPSTPLPADGIKARSARGPIATTWWSQRFTSVLEQFGYGPRLQRGRTYARKGQVLDLALEAGSVTSSVQGSRPTPYRVTIELTPLTAPEWARVIEALTSRAVFLARLLAGEMPDEIEEAFSAAGCSLFPQRAADLRMACSCPDWAVPCKHVAAVLYLLAERFDEDPWLVLAWRGRTRAEVLDALAPRASAGRRRSRGARATPVVDLTDRRWDWGWPSEVPAASASDFWVASDTAVTAEGAAATPPDGLLRLLGPLPLDAAGERVVERLARAYADLSDAGVTLRAR